MKKNQTKPTKRRPSVQDQIAKDKAVQERLAQLGMLCFFASAIGTTGFIEAL
jgi:hypothetical protein